MFLNIKKYYKIRLNNVLSTSICQTQPIIHLKYVPDMVVGSARRASSAAIRVESLSTTPNGRLLPRSGLCAWAARACFTAGQIKKPAAQPVAPESFARAKTIEQRRTTPQWNGAATRLFPPPSLRNACRRSRWSGAWSTRGYQPHPKRCA